MENKKECNIVKDLLLGYSDDVLSKDSKEFVEEHLKKCKKCEKLLDEINKEKQIEANEQIEEIDYLKKVRRKVNNKNIIIKIIGSILFVLILINLVVYINYKTKLGNMIIYLNKDVTEEQMKNIEEQIKEIDSEVEIRFHSKEEILNDMKEKFKENHKFIDGYNEKNNPFSPFYEIKVNSNSAGEIQERIINMEGIKFIDSNINRNPYEVLLRN